MNAQDAQITIAVLQSVEEQANSTAAALEKVLSLMQEIERRTPK